jgi:hypothetical protein
MSSMNMNIHQVTSIEQKTYKVGTDINKFYVTKLVIRTKGDNFEITLFHSEE